jgi:hypothetical protein
MGRSHIGLLESRDVEGGSHPRRLSLHILGALLGLPSLMTAKVAYKSD